MRHFVLDDNDRAVEVADLLEWAAWMRDNDERCQVALDDLGAAGVVSTIFLGADHKIGGEGPPLLFETMLFEGDQNYRERCSTRKEAERQHRGVAAMMRRGQIRRVK